MFSVLLKRGSDMADPIQSSGFDTQKTFDQLMGVQRPYLEGTATAREAVAGAEADIARAQQTQAEAKSKALVEPTQKYVSDVQSAQQAYQQKKEAEPIPAFVPTRDSVEDLAKLFSFIGVMGTYVGRGGGKQSAMGAMSAMTGMMNGWQQGRKDLYDQEKVKFEKDFNRVQKVHQDLAKDLETAIKTASTNKELGVRLAEEAAVKAGSDIVAAQIKKGNLVAAYETSKEMLRASDKVGQQVKSLLDADIRARASVEAAAARATGKTPPREPLGTIQYSRNPDSGNIVVISRKGVEELPGTKKVPLPSETKAEERDSTRERKAAELSPVERKEYRGLQNLSSEIELLAETFKPEYANFVSDRLGDFTAKFQARIAKDPAMADWWRRYENVALPERHSMFGATLTGGERDSWRKSSIGAGNSTEEILSWIADKERVMGRKIDLLLEPPPARPVKRPASVAAPAAKPQGSGTKEDPIKLD
jgi:hypothetical protein